MHEIQVDFDFNLGSRTHAQSRLTYSRIHTLVPPSTPLCQTIIGMRGEAYGR